MSATQSRAGRCAGVTSLSRRSLLAGATAALPLAAAPALAQDTDWPALAQAVKAEMRWAWHQYRAVAWGQDEVKPVSGTGQSFLIKKHSVGLSIVEALDTLWLMGLDAELEDAVRWIRYAFFPVRWICGIK